MKITIKISNPMNQLQLSINSDLSKLEHNKRISPKENYKLYALIESIYNGVLSQHTLDDARVTLKSKTVNYINLDILYNENFLAMCKPSVINTPDGLKYDSFLDLAITTP